MADTKLEQDELRGSGAPVSPNPASLTPAMRQYVEQKERVGDAILLFRMGDFYETFYDDAVLCSRVLGIALTARSKGKNPIPLAGIPYHALDGYLKKLVDAGYKVAISEQLEDPKQAKGVVKRDVVRIVTAGTLTDESLLDARDDNTLAAVVIDRQSAGFALVELASGRFETVEVKPEALLDELARVRPDELLIDDEREGAAEAIGESLRQLCGTAPTRRAGHEFTSYQAEQALLKHFGVSTLAGFGFDAMSPSLRSAGAILQYLRETQKTAISHIVSMTRRVTEQYVQIDHNTWRSLEIDRTIRGESREGSLLTAIDRTVHPIGGRKLRRWLRLPLIDAERIVARQDAVQHLVENEAVRASLRSQLKRMADVERIAGRVALGRATPRDLRGLGRALEALPAMAELLRESRIGLFMAASDDLGGLDDLCELLGRAIQEDPSPSPKDGGVIADGFDSELDRLRGVRADGRSWIADYQCREIDRTGIASLKVGFNRVFGYYIEILNSHRDRVPVEYVRKQTIKNAERYITEELKKYETDVLTADERACELEVRLFESVRTEAAQRVAELLCVADAIGRVDCIAGLAELAVQRRYARPDLTDEGRLEIHDGRHPVLDQTLGDDFVPNDTTMSSPDARTFVITGPNMAGKSTYIRQVALMTLLAQVGSFVPARKMTLSLVDRIFARVGASDELSRGQSTFMVEMTESANILHNATERSLVVLDELGRGTSTFDGLSLAWAITEHLTNKTRCRCLIATHYHEMTELASLLAGVCNFNVAVREHATGADGEEGVIFLHRIVPGSASKSYGIQVARLAGIPQPVIRRSREILQELERGFEREARTPNLTPTKTKDAEQLTLFGNPAEELLDEIRSIHPDELTPLDALQCLAEWKKRFDS